MLELVWLYSDEQFERLFEFGDGVLQEFWEPRYDSAYAPPDNSEWVDEETYLRPRYPQPSTVPKQPLVMATRRPSDMSLYCVMSMSTADTSTLAPKRKPRKRGSGNDMEIARSVSLRAIPCMSWTPSLRTIRRHHGRLSRKNPQPGLWFPFSRAPRRTTSNTNTTLPLSCTST